MKKMKILCLSALSLLLALTVTLIPFNLFCINFPEWVTVVPGVCLCVGLIVYLVAFKTKLITKIVLPALFGLCAAACSFAPYLLPYWNSYNFKNYYGTVKNYDEVITLREAQKDLDALGYYLKKVHPMFLSGFDEETERAFGAAEERLKNAERITVNDLRREIQSVLHPMFDAHTTTYNSYPNDRYLKDAPQKTHEGYGIDSVNGKKVGQIFEEAKPYFCYEREDLISIDLGSLASLEFYGFHAPFVIEWSNGKDVLSETYTQADFVSWEEFIGICNGYFNGEEPKDFVYYEIDEQRSLAVLTLTECNNNAFYADCVRRMFTEVKQKNIKNVAVDLRGNGGGSSGVVNEFIKYLPADSYTDVPCDARLGFLTVHRDGKTENKKYGNLTFGGSVYVLTDKYSFSSAMDFAMMIQDNGLGKVVGESPSNAVNGYGDVACFYLPETGIFVQISTKKWYRTDGSNPDGYVMPDYPCDGGDCYQTLCKIISQ